MRTQIGIIGAGPAGLLLARLLELAGIESVVLEARSREYVEHRIRAGVLEQGTVDCLRTVGVSDRLDREGLIHHGVELRFEGEGHRIALTELAGGRSIVVYGQQEMVKDLIAARLESGLPLLFDVPDVAVHRLDTHAPVITYGHEGAEHLLRCDFIAGCDGFHGICRKSIPNGGIRAFEREYPFAWLGIVATVEPSTEELIYAYHDRGFALHSMRSPTLSRFYVQCSPEAQLEQWPDDRIWEELELRLVIGGSGIRRGPIVEKGVTPMRSYVAEPMAYGRLFLAGDAAHIVPPTGAKGLNLAVADVKVLAAALERFYGHRDEAGLDAYSETCLRRVWRAEHFSWWMTSMLHRFPDDDGFSQRLQLAQLRYVCRSKAAATTLAENYVGLEVV